jgi:NO-binding membrane sensor protein with MHYT domain
MTHSYDALFVIPSVVLAILASFLAFSVISRATLLSSFVIAPCAQGQSLGALRRPSRLRHLKQDTQ